MKDSKERISHLRRCRPFPSRYLWYSHMKQDHELVQWFTLQISICMSETKNRIHIEYQSQLFHFYYKTCNSFVLTIFYVVISCVFSTFQITRDFVRARHGMSFAASINNQRGWIMLQIFKTMAWRKNSNNIYIASFIPTLYTHKASMFYHYSNPHNISLLDITLWERILWARENTDCTYN